MNHNNLFNWVISWNRSKAEGIWGAGLGAIHCRGFGKDCYLFEGENNYAGGLLNPDPALGKMHRFHIRTDNAVVHFYCL
jgi:hypothetical protein